MTRVDVEESSLPEDESNRTESIITLKIYRSGKSGLQKVKTIKMII